MPSTVKKAKSYRETTTVTTLRLWQAGEFFPLAASKMETGVAFVRSEQKLAVGSYAEIVDAVAGRNPARFHSFVSTTISLDLLQAT